MKGKKSAATARREALESKGDLPLSSATVRMQRDRVRVAKKDVKKPVFDDPIKEAMRKGVELADKYHDLRHLKPSVPQVNLGTFLQQNQDDPVGAARKIMAEAMPDMCRRLARIVRGAEPGWSPREQITAMRLSADIAGIVQAPGAGSDVAPLTQASLAELRATIAQGEERMRELQAQLIERQAESIPGVVVDDRTTDPVHDEPTGQQESVSHPGDTLD